MRLVFREGDLLCLDSLDRLGRDYDGIISEWKYINREVNADIIVLENESLFDSRKFKTMGDLGKLLEDQFSSMLSYVAEQERKKTKQRQAEGIEVALKQGVRFGRPKREITTEFIRVYTDWKKGTISAVEAMKRVGMKPNTFYRRVNDYEEFGFKSI
jgi:DNA invertase Pin-like site-specific DNA recombinase